MIWYYSFEQDTKKEASFCPNQPKRPQGHQSWHPLIGSKLRKSGGRKDHVIRKPFMGISNKVIHNETTGIYIISIIH